DEALAVIDELRNGDNVASLGINGSAIYDDQGLTGIWVASVESGSPAEMAGLLGGDIVTQMEGLTLAPDGTMANYCEILRSHGPDETMSIQVLRYETQEVLEGQINGRPLAHSFSFAQELGEEVDNGTTTPDYAEYVQVTDDTGSISVEIPWEWSDIDGSVWEDEGEVLGAAIVASSDVDAYYESYAIPGVIFLASEQLATMGDATDLLDLFEFGQDCSFEGRYEYEDALYAGYYDLYSYCDSNDMVLVVVAALPEDQSFASLLVVQAITDADLDAIDHILDTFVVIGELPDSQAGGGTQMGEATLSVINLTDDSIWYIYISPSGADSWGEDWLGGDVLMSGDTYYFTLPEGNYDLAAADSDGLIIVERYNEYISGDKEWTIYLEGDESGYYDVRMVNNSGQDVCFVFIASSDSADWGDDWLGEDQVIQNNDSITFQVPTGYASYDMQALDCDGNIISEDYYVELLGNKVWTINP
ncbi:MAG: PDZ domain-containing protein, partial [Anaerolineales bacterium]|nr:PDZ domain-containing protein [Anaerolineales bacterium]